MRGSYLFESQIVPLAVVIPLFVSSETVSWVAQAHFHAEETREDVPFPFFCLLKWWMRALAALHEGPSYSVDQAIDVPIVKVG